MIGNCLGYFEKPHSYVKTSLASLGATFGKNWATFYANIWSHCAYDRLSSATFSFLLSPEQKKYNREKYRTFQDSWAVWPD